MSTAFLRALCLFVFGWSLAQSAGADVVHIAEGSYEGVIRSRDDRTVVLETGHGTRTFYPDEIERLETGPVARNGTRRFPFGLGRAYGFYGESDYILRFSLQKPEPDFEDWRPWLKGILTFTNTTGKDLYVYLAVALFDAEGRLLSGSAFPWFDEEATASGVTQNINLEFGLAGYTVGNVDHFLATFVESPTPLLPADVESAR